MERVYRDRGSLEEDVAGTRLRVLWPGPTCCSLSASSLPMCDGVAWGLSLLPGPHCLVTLVLSGHVDQNKPLLP